MTTFLGLLDDKVSEDICKLEGGLWEQHTKARESDDEVGKIIYRESLDLFYSIFKSYGDFFYNLTKLFHELLNKQTLVVTALDDFKSLEDPENKEQTIKNLEHAILTYHKIIKSVQTVIASCDKAAYDIKEEFNLSPNELNVQPKDTCHVHIDVHCEDCTCEN